MLFLYCLDVILVHVSLEGANCHRFDFQRKLGIKLSYLVYRGHIDAVLRTSDVNL